MAKKLFYSLCRYKDKTDGTIKCGYLPREGEDVPNDLGFDLGIYRAKDESAATNWKEAKTWFVVDTRCGLSVAEGSTKKEAIGKALDTLSKVDMDKYNEKVRKTAECYGECPGHRISYL